MIMERVSDKVKSIESVTYYYTEKQEKIIVKSISFDDKEKRIVLKKEYNENPSMIIFYNENELVTDIYTFGKDGFIKSKGALLYDEKGTHIDSKNEMYQENIHIKTIINRDWEVIMKKVEEFLAENKNITEKSVDFAENEEVLYQESGTKVFYDEKGNERKKIEKKGDKVFITEHTIEYY